MTKNSILMVLIIVLSLGIVTVVYFAYVAPSVTPAITNPEPVSTSTTVAYVNVDYGFTFALPNSWQGTAASGTATTSGPKILIRNPKWTEAVPYEDLPILVFTLAQWNAYITEKFTFSAAPVQATELAHNNAYVFALPPRWDFDYNFEYKEAQDIFAGKPLTASTITEPVVSQAKININVVCQNALSYMKFASTTTAATFVTDCVAGKHPEVIEKYKTDLNLGTGTVI